MCHRADDRTLDGAVGIARDRGRKIQFDGLLEPDFEWGVLGKGEYGQGIEERNDEDDEDRSRKSAVDQMGKGGNGVENQ